MKAAPIGCSSYYTNKKLSLENVRQKSISKTLAVSQRNLKSDLKEVLAMMTFRFLWAIPVSNYNTRQIKRSRSNGTEKYFRK